MNGELSSELRRAVAAWLLGRSRARTFDRIAADLVAAGHGGPSVVALAVLDPEEAVTVEMLACALEEVGLDLPSPAEARWLEAMSVAGRIVADEVTPCDGADDIWMKLVSPSLADEGEELQPLYRFGGLVDDWHDFPEKRPEIEEDIRRHARRLLASQ